MTTHQHLKCKSYFDAVMATHQRSVRLLYSQEWKQISKASGTQKFLTRVTMSTWK